MSDSTRDPRTVDADGFVIGAGRQPSGFGSRPGIGGLSSAVSDGARTGIVVGLDTMSDTSGLLLYVVWLPGQAGPIAENDPRRDAAYTAAERGEAEIDSVPAAGLIALDAWMPAEESS